MVLGQKSFVLNFVNLEWVSKKEKKKKRKNDDRTTVEG